MNIPTHYDFKSVEPCVECSKKVKQMKEQIVITLTKNDKIWSGVIRGKIDNKQTNKIQIAAYQIKPFDVLKHCEYEVNKTLKVME